MESKNYHKTITVNVSAEEATKKISEVNRWWAKKLEGETERPNDHFKVDFGKTFVNFEVSEVIPGKKIAWKVTDCNLHWIKNKKEWKDTELVFVLSEQNGRTKIDFTHNGLCPETECYKDCKAGWNEHIGDSLVKFMNEGSGMPV